jgi:c(7)-type cytochrome triheme protein
MKSVSEGTPLRHFIPFLVLVLLATQSGCSTTPTYGHGDLVVGGKAIFRHKANDMKKLDCAECHDKVYTDVKHHEKRDMEQIIAGESCGTCHNGKRAFTVTGNCNACHRKYYQRPTTVTKGEL